MESTNRDRNDLREQVQKTLAEVETLRDDVKLHVHLARLDLQKVWNEIDPEYTRIRAAARDATGRTLEALHGALVEVRKQLSTLREKLMVRTDVDRGGKP